MKVLPDLRKSQHRRTHPAREHVESDELAHGEVAVDHQPCAVIQSSGNDQLVDELHTLARGIAEADDLEARSDIAGELLLPAPLHLRLDRH